MIYRESESTVGVELPAYEGGGTNSAFDEAGNS